MSRVIRQASAESLDVNITPAQFDLKQTQTTFVVLSIPPQCTCTKIATFFCFCLYSFDIKENRLPLKLRRVTVLSYEQTKNDLGGIIYPCIHSQPKQAYSAKMLILYET